VSPRAWCERMDGILTCARNIGDYTEGISFDAFLDDPKTIRPIAKLIPYAISPQRSRSLRALN
jgi:uncharacterized protein with HEPN domain